jgi:LacI family transcriptional regulator
MSPASKRSARDSVGVAALLSERIASGGFRVGCFLPPVRSLAKELDVSRETVRRAMKALEQKRLVATTARHGFRVMRRPKDPEKVVPVAYVMSSSDGVWRGIEQQLLVQLQSVAADNGFSVAGISANGRGAREVTEQLQAAPASGLVLDSGDPALVAEVEKLGLPTVMVESASPGGLLDSVIQDGFGGGLQAAEHLVGLGHKRIGWVGPIGKSFQGLQRWGGAVAGLRGHGLELDPRLILDTNPENDPVGKIQAALSGADRPTGVIALWRPEAIAAGRAATRLGLRIGRDLDIVGWVAEENYPEFVSAFPENQLPAAVTWRIRSLAEAVMARLAERRRRPGLPVMRMVIETELRLGAGDTGPVSQPEREGERT